jgi:deazaflavin-dependent oxidoreductase (nitroreductase family)
MNLDSLSLRREAIRWFGRFHEWAYEASDGRWGAKLGGLPMLVLRSVGRKSGQTRTTPLVYLPHGDEFVVVASFYGSPSHPAWYRNLQAQPACELRAGRRRLRAVARTAGPEERARLWPRLLELYPGYAEYQRRTEREIPVVVLSPVGPVEGPAGSRDEAEESAWSRGVAHWLEGRLNRVRPVALPPVSERARRLHAASFVADLHADSLMFGRDLLVRSDVGHVDLPRLQEGGVGLQVFTAVTKVPLGFNKDRTDGSRPNVLEIVDRVRLSPLAGAGLLERALVQARRLERFAQASDGKLVLVRTRGDLERLLERQARETPKPVGALLGIEGAHTLEGDPKNLDRVFEAGVRLIGLSHFHDNEFAGSAHGLERGGLSEAGRELLAGMESRGMLVDLAHASPAVVDEVLARVHAPTVFSHGGVRGTCDNNRNLSDQQVKAIAAGGGVVGIGYWDWALGDTEVGSLVAAISHVVGLVGDAHVGLGSDYDGATTVGFDTSRLPSITQALLDAGFAEESVARILGGNVLRVLRAVLPS